MIKRLVIVGIACATLAACTTNPYTGECQASKAGAGGG